MVNKRGDLSLRFIVLALIAIIVLIIVVLIFTGAAGDFVEKIKAITSGIFQLSPDISELK